MTALLAAAVLHLLAPACPADEQPPRLAVERITACAGRVAHRGELLTYGCFIERTDTITIDPRTPLTRVTAVVVHESIHRSRYVCRLPRWDDERYVARLTREALR